MPRSPNHATASSVSGPCGGRGHSRRRLLPGGGWCRPTVAIAAAVQHPVICGILARHRRRPMAIVAKKDRLPFSAVVTERQGSVLCFLVCEHLGHTVFWFPGLSERRAIPAWASAACVSITNPAHKSQIATRILGSIWFPHLFFRDFLIPVVEPRAGRVEPIFPRLGRQAHQKIIALLKHAK